MHATKFYGYLKNCVQIYLKTLGLLIKLSKIILKILIKFSNFHLWYIMLCNVYDKSLLC